jgi:chromosomal replication initiator protein
VNTIIAFVAIKHGLKPCDLTGNSRLRELIPARYEAIYLARTHTRLSMPRLGEIFGRDHTTILYALNAHKRRLGIAGEPGGAN